MNKQSEFPQSLTERFIEASFIDSGGAGSVFKAHDKVLMKDVAIKVLPKSASKEQIVRFQQEAKATSKLNHPNLVKIFNFEANEAGDVFMVMELVEGESLAKFIKQQNLIDIKFSINVFQQICLGMAHAHENNILHRDLKPGNVLLRQDAEGDYTLKIIDFGIAKVFDVGVALTTGTIAIGTPAYMSPEQGKGERVDRRSDIYSFGCMMYEFLTKEKPFVGESALETLYKHANDEIPILSKSYGDDVIPEQLAQVAYKCLSKEKEQRFSDFQEVYEALENIIRTIEEEANPQEKEETQTTSNLPDRENNPFVLLTVISLVVIAGIFAAVLYSPPIDSNQDSEKNLNEVKLPVGETIPLTEIPKFDPKFSKSSNSKLAKKARLHMKDKDHEKAIPFLSKLIERYENGDDLKGKHLEVFAKRVECYVRLNYFDLAKKDIDWLKEHDNRGTFYNIAAGDNEYLKNHYDMAIRFYNKALANDPDLVKTRYQRMVCLYKKRKFRDAINDAKILVKQKNYRTQILKFRAKSYLELDNEERALNDYNRLIKNHKKKDEIRAEFLYERALVFRKLEKPIEVISDTTEAITLYPENSRLYELRAWAYNKIGKTHKANADIAKIEK